MVRTLIKLGSDPRSPTHDQVNCYTLLTSVAKISNIIELTFETGIL